MADEVALGFDVGESFPELRAERHQSADEGVDDHHGVSGSRFDVGSGQTESPYLRTAMMRRSPGDPAADLLGLRLASA